MSWLNINHRERAKRCIIVSLRAVIAAAILFMGCISQTAAQVTTVNGEKVIIDTDIGGDIDDAFAIGLALQSPELKILGISSATGDVGLRARLLSRMLFETGHMDIPVAVGVMKPGVKPGEGLGGQKAYAAIRFAGKQYPDAVDFLLDQIRKQPGEITLIAIGPLTNIAAAIDKDAASFRKVRRVVIMGGSVYKGYDDGRAHQSQEPAREYNIVADVPAAQKLFTSGVPLYVMPLDSTIIKLQEIRRAGLTSAGTPITDAITLLYCQWSPGCTGTPTLFDPVAVAYAIRPDLCPATPLHLQVDDTGYTRPGPGELNVQVCLNSDAEKFLDFLMLRLTAPTAKPQ